jgi:hypothetical protein
MKPMEMTRIGTVQDPIPIYSLVSDSHPTKEDVFLSEARG